MSQHYFETTYEHKKVLVFAGWDRPLQGYFLVIEKMKPDTPDYDLCEEDMYLYSNLADSEPHPKTFNKFQEILDMLNIKVPPEMIAEILEDGKNNTGNKVVHHFYTKDGVYARKGTGGTP